MVGWGGKALGASARGVDDLGSGWIDTGMSLSVVCIDERPSSCDGFTMRTNDGRTESGSASIGGRLEG